MFWWRLTTNGAYSSSLAYSAFFFAAGQVNYAQSLWKNIDPPKEKFITWLVLRNRCWTVDMLERRGLPRPAQYPLCDQAPVTMDRLITIFSFARKVQFISLSHRGFETLTPTTTDTTRDWWWSTVSRVPARKAKETTQILRQHGAD